MMTSMKTEGAGPKVKTKYLSLGAGAVQEVIPAIGNGGKIRVVGVQLSSSSADIIVLFYSGTATADNVICAADLGAHTPFVAQMNDWAPQIGGADEQVSAYVAVGTAQIVVHYIEME